MQTDPVQKSSAISLVGSGGGDDPFHVIAEAIPGIIWVCDAEGACTYVSRHWFEYTGVDLTAGTNVSFNFVHPDDQEAGKQIWQQALKSGQRFETQLRLRRHDGAFRWHRVRGVPDRNAGARVERWVGVAIDIEEVVQVQTETATRHADLSLAKEELERTVAERTRELQDVIEQLEAFAYSIAHDMRAPLRTMHQYAETVARDFAARVPDEVRIYLNKIMAASERLDSLIREVLVYTKVSQGRIEMQPMSLESLLSEILLMYPQLNPPQAELHARLPLHPVLGDETALTQAFSNLLTNAVKFVPKGRKPEVNVWTEKVGDKVRIYIKDNGIGIPAGDRDRIFKMFERLQPESKFEGSGIGLTIVRRAVERMGGKIGVDSTEGQGSTFWMELQKGDL